MSSPYVVSKSVRSLSHLFTKIRDKNTSRVEFCRFCNRLMTILCEEGLSHGNPQKVTITTPTGSVLEGEKVECADIVAVSIIRAGDSLLECFMNIAPEAQLPSLVAKNIMLLDPMLATGGSAKAAIQVLLDNGASENKIVFLSVVSCPEGLAAIQSAYPTVQIVTGTVDDGLNEKAYIVPGLGDYGDRFYGTDA